VEGGCQPVTGIVALGAIRGDTRRGVIRVGSGGVFLGVAPVTRRRRARETVPRVATGAIERGMHADQRKASETRMVELHGQPVVGVMALLAGNGEFRCGMVNSPGAGEIIDVAGCAS